MRLIKLSDFLTTRELRRIIFLRTAKAIHDEIIQPNIERIDKALGQKNDPMYLAYLCEYVLSQASK